MPDSVRRSKNENGSGYYDAIEDEPKFQAIIGAVRKQADLELINHPWRNGKGYCHVHWERVKRILKEDHDIDWHSPLEMNPHIMYD